MANDPLIEEPMDYTPIGAELRDERDRWIRLFNRLEAAISHHKKAKTPDGKPRGLSFTDEIDEALYAARDRILRDAASHGRERRG